MKALDRFLQRARIHQARPFVNMGDRVLDIGSVDGVMFEAWRGHISAGVGIDPTLNEKVVTDLYELYPGYFPNDLPDGRQFNVITLLAVLEHIPTSQQESLAKSIHEALLPGGRLIITVPSPQVDMILEVLLKLRLIDGMSLEEHFGYKPEDTERIFAKPHFKLLNKKTFQLGLNNLFVFEKI